MASGIYDRFKSSLLAGSMDLDADSFKLGLLDSSHSFNPTGGTWADVSANQVTGSEYVAGGKVIPSTSIVQGGSAVWLAGSVVWEDSTITARHGVIYNDDVDDILVASLDFGEDKSSVDGNFEVKLIIFTSI